MSDTAVVRIEEDEPPRALVRAENAAEAGTLALALMSDQEFETRLAALKKGRDRMAIIQRSLMDKDVDYGTIPGTPKPTLLKPGAEKLCSIYHYAADLLPERKTGDGVTAPAIAYQTRCELHLGSLDGPVIAVGYGSANSWERKHRYRTGERACPACGVTGTLLRSKRGKAEWFCWAKKGGCGATFPLDEPKIAEQTVGGIENPDPSDLDNTLLKMSEKRALIDGTLRGTAASGLFTQDIEDMPQPPAEREPEPARRTLREVVAAPEPLTRQDLGNGPAGVPDGDLAEFNEPEAAAPLPAGLVLTGLSANALATLCIEARATKSAIQAALAELGTKADPGELTSTIRLMTDASRGDLATALGLKWRGEQMA